MKSWDVFDTVIGRKCGTPMNLFRIMEEQTGIRDFTQKRVIAERTLQRQQQPYTLQDIYKQFGNVKLADMEFNLELDNVFPIKRHTRMIQDGDIMVSDMYLSESEIRLLLAKAGIDFEGKLYVSNSGKRKGNIWKKIKENHPNISQHYGDNKDSDVTSPINAGIRGRRVLTGPSKIETLYGDYSPHVAWWIRRHRLEKIVHETQERLNYDQLVYNVPLLWAISVILEDYRKTNNIKKLLFMSRDTQLLSYIFKAMFPETETEYIYISRDALRTASPSYMSYLNRVYTSDTALVDLSASCGSLKQVLPLLKNKSPKIFTAIFLKEPFRVDTTGIDVTWIATNTELRINNTFLEMLNYADHLHVADLRDDGHFILDMEGEYDMKKVLGYHNIVKGMLEDVPAPVETENAKKIFKMAIDGIQSEKSFIGRQFPQHIVMERKRKRKILAERPKDHVAVIGAIDRYTWNHIEHWWMSLMASGFNGEIHMMCYNINTQTKAQLKRAGIKVHEFKLTGKQVVVDRFRDLPILLKQFPTDQWVIFPDVGDLVFQYNPAEFLISLNSSQSIVAAHEGVLFKDNQWMANNLKTSFPQYEKRLWNEFFYNAGSIAARAEVFCELAEGTYRMCINDALEGATSHDQTAMNVMLHKNKRRALLTGPEDIWAFNGASSMFAQPGDAENYKFKMPVVKGGICLINDQEQKPCIFHHYTRDKKTTREVHTRVKNSYSFFLRATK